MEQLKSVNLEQPESLEKLNAQNMRLKTPSKKP